jgi:hypothetical protein
MLSRTAMANSRTNQFKVMLSDAEKVWLEEIAADRGLTSSDVLRVYIRDSHAELLRGKEPAHGNALASLTDEQRDVIWGLSDSKGGPQSIEALGRTLDAGGIAVMGLARVLNELRDLGLVRRPSGGYVLTGAGWELCSKKNWRSRRI